MDYTYIAPFKERIQPHSHLCLIYDTLSAYRAIASEYIRHGLECHDKCILATEAYTPYRIHRDLEEQGLDPAAYCASGQLTIRSAADQYTSESDFDGARAIRFWQEATKTARAEGYRALRVIGEAAFALHGAKNNLHALIEYENLLNRDLFPTYPFISLCVYDKHRFSTTVLRAAIRAHPILLYNTDFYEHNIYYIPPERHFATDMGKREIDAMLDNVAANNSTVQRLRESERRYKTLFEKSTSAQFIIENEAVADCNQTAMDIFEATQKADLLGLPLHLFFPNEQHDGIFTPKLLRTYFSLAEHKHVERTDITCKRFDGSLFEAFIAISRLEHEQCRFLLRIQDISELRQLERQLASAQRLEAIGRLAGGVAHDFNNLLSPILGYSELLLQGRISQDKVHECLEYIYDSGKRGRNLTRQLLAFGRRQHLALEVLDLNHVLSDLLKLLRKTLREDIRVETVFNAPASGFWGDVGQIEQVLMNLALNAQDAMPEGGTLTITTERLVVDAEFAERHPGVEPGPALRLLVADTGEGLDEDTKRQIFDPFFTTKGKEKGTGLGLATVYGIVKQHGGSIWVESRPGQGTCFEITFPETRRPATKERPAAPQHLPHAERPTRVLIVEDDNLLRDVAAEMLHQLGYQVATAQDGAEAARIFAQHPSIDLLLADVVLPGYNGREVFKQLRTQAPRLKVLYMSGYTRDALTTRGLLEEGACL
ncbi:MAG: MEDS domain-containing protein, partial [Thermodesulfobacteriota bacterium]